MPFFLGVWVILKPIVAILKEIEIKLNGLAILAIGIGVLIGGWSYTEHAKGKLIRAIREAEERAIAKTNADIAMVVKVRSGEIAMTDERLREIDSQLRVLMKPEVRYIPGRDVRIAVPVPVPAVCKISDAERAREKQIRLRLDQINVSGRPQ